MAAQAIALASVLAVLPAHAEEALTLGAPAAAAPAPPELVDSAVSTLIDAVKVSGCLVRQLMHTPCMRSGCAAVSLQTAGGAVKSGLDLVGVGLGYAKDVRMPPSKPAAGLLVHCMAAVTGSFGTEG